MVEATLTNEGIKHQLNGEAVLLAGTPERIQWATAFDRVDKRYMRLYETTHVGGRVTHDAEFSDTIEGLSGSFPIEQTQMFTWCYVFEWDLGINLISRHLVG